MIIVEGCDATGKSTLAKRLAEDLGFKYFKDGFHRLGLKYYVGHALKQSHLTVSDRFHLGEYVYPIVKQDGRKPLTAWQQLMVERILVTKPSVLVLCETSMQNIHKNFDERGEDFITKEQAIRVVDLFKERFDLSILPKVKFDYTKDSYDHLLRTLKVKVMDNLKLAQLTEEMESTGVLKPKVMLVGEAHNLKKLGKVNRAFSHPSASSLYLHQAIGLNSDVSYYITNAMKSKDLDDSIYKLRHEVRTVCPKKVIALGNMASAVLDKAEIEHVKTFHPSYWKRFHHKELLDYASFLR